MRVASLLRESRVVRPLLHKPSSDTTDTDGPTADALRESLYYLAEAEVNYKVISLLQPLQDTQFLLATVYHNLNMQKERDEAAERCHATELQRKEMAEVASEDWMVQVWDLVSKVGAAIATKT